LIVTTHANAKYSRVNWDTPADDVIADLEAVVKQYLQDGATITSTQLKKWRYSVPLITYPQEYLMAEGLPNLVFAGDAFGGRGRVEGAFMSGISAGQSLVESLG